VGAPFGVARLGGCPHQAAWDKSRRRIAAILVSVFFHLTGDEMERAESSVEGDICKLVDWRFVFFFWWHGRATRGNLGLRKFTDKLGKSVIYSQKYITFGTKYVYERPGDNIFAY